MEWDMAQKERKMDGCALFCEWFCGYMLIGCTERISAILILSCYFLGTFLVLPLLLFFFAYGF
jgi:hypothetical protein